MEATDVSERSRWYVHFFMSRFSRIHRDLTNTVVGLYENGVSKSLSNM